MVHGTRIYNGLFLHRACMHLVSMRFASNDLPSMVNDMMPPMPIAWVKVRLLAIADTRRSREAACGASEAKEEAVPGATRTVVKSTTTEDREPPPIMMSSLDPRSTGKA